MLVSEVFEYLGSGLMTSIFNMLINVSLDDKSPRMRIFKVLFVRNKI